MKAATTTLCVYLQRHPGIYVSTPKEPMFFSRDHVYARGLVWYSSLFDTARPDQICGEASTCYTRWPVFPDAPGRIRRAVPGVRLVYVLRHPVDRAYSHYKHVFRNKRKLGLPETLTLREALTRVPDILSASDYISQIERYTEHFSPEQMLLLKFEDLVENPSRVLATVQAWLGLTVMNLVDASPVHANPHSRERVLQHTAKIRTDEIRRSSVGRAVRKGVPAPLHGILRGIVSFAAKRSPGVNRRVAGYYANLTPLTPDARSTLLTELNPATAKLEGFLGWDLSEWRR